MPGWARPEDLWFDHAAAAEAVGALAALRFVVTMSWSAEHAAGEDALGSWQGAAARGFAASLGARANATEAALGAAVRLQTAIEDAIGDAIAGQRRIDVLQAEWDAERAAEDRAAHGAPGTVGGAGGAAGGSLRAPAGGQSRFG